MKGTPKMPLGNVPRLSRAAALVLAREIAQVLHDSPRDEANA